MKLYLSLLQRSERSSFRDFFFFFHNHDVVEVITIKNREKVFFLFSRYSECGSTEMKLHFFWS